MTLSQMFDGCQCVVVVRGSGQLLLGLPYPISLPYQSKALCLQFVCNQANHSMVKTTNLFLQCPIIFLVKSFVHLPCSYAVD